MTRVRHVGIVVRDIARSLTFYRDLLGLSVIRAMDEEGTFLDAILGVEQAKVHTVKLAAKNADAQIELLAFANPSIEVAGSSTLFRTGPTHVAFTVDDLDAVFHRLKAAGTPFTTDPVISPDGKAKVTFCRDPDGTALELVEMLKQ